jgi:hypothetical protein
MGIAAVARARMARRAGWRPLLAIHRRRSAGEASTATVSRSLDGGVEAQRRQA